MIAPYIPPMTPDDFKIWNYFGLTSSNGVVTIPLTTLGLMLQEARQQGPEEVPTTPES